MKFTEQLHEGIFLKRYKRFFADIRIGKDIHVAHVPNTGSLKSCLFPEIPCRYTESSNPERKLKFTLYALKTETSWVGVNTSISNALVEEVFTEKLNPKWKKFDRVQREVKISKETRFDMVLWSSKDHPDLEKVTEKDLKTTPLHFIEVKNVTLAEDGIAQFPDAVTERGQKHIRELMKLMKMGHTAELVFTVQREDCKTFKPADHIDEDYGKLLREAVEQGLIVSAWPCTFTEQEISLDPKQPLKLML